MTGDMTGDGVANNSWHSSSKDLMHPAIQLEAMRRPAGLVFRSPQRG